jgi:hypothetical protein
MKSFYRIPQPDNLIVTTRNNTYFSRSYSELLVLNFSGGNIVLRILQKLFSTNVGILKRGKIDKF